MNQTEISPQVIEVMTLEQYQEYLQLLSVFTLQYNRITIDGNSIAKRLKEKHILVKRHKPRLTPNGLAQIGVNAHQYSLILDNKKQPTCFTVVQLSKLFIIPIDQLVTYTINR